MYISTPLSSSLIANVSRNRCKKPEFFVKIQALHFQDGKFIVYLQFLDLILQYSEIQQFTISLQIEKFLIFTRKNAT